MTSRLYSRFTLMRRTCRKINRAHRLMRQQVSVSLITGQSTGRNVTSYIDESMRTLAKIPHLVLEVKQALDHNNLQKTLQDGNLMCVRARA